MKEKGKIRGNKRKKRVKTKEKRKIDGNKKERGRVKKWKK